MYVEGDYSSAGGARAAETFLAMTDRPDGVVLTNDWMALGFMAVVRGAGIRIPEALSVVGFDGIDAARYSEPPLTTYRQPMAEMGAEAARLLLNLIAGEPPPDVGRIIFAGDVVIRGSS